MPAVEPLVNANISDCISVCKIYVYIIMDIDYVVNILHLPLKNTAIN